MEIFLFISNYFSRSCDFFYFTAGMFQDVYISLWKGKRKPFVDLLLPSYYCAIEKLGTVPKCHYWAESQTEGISDWESFFGSIFEQNKRLFLLESDKMCNRE